MTLTKKVLFVGLSGAGKTTALRVIDENACFVGETERDPTAEEIKAWAEFPKKIPTSRIPNWGQTVYRRLNESQIKHIPIENFDGKLAPEDILVHIFDMCGQYEFFPFIEEYSIGCDGLLFLVDGSRELRSHCDEIYKAYLIIREYFEKRGDPFPPTVVVANKIDIVQRKKIEKGTMKLHIFLRTILRSYPMGKVFNEMGFISASALEGEGIEEAVEMLLQYILHLKKPDESEER